MVELIPPTPGKVVVSNNPQQSVPPPTAQPNTTWFQPDQPLWLPPGSVRALLTIALLTTTATLLIVYKWCPTELIAMTTAATTSYMTSKQQTNA